MTPSPPKGQQAQFEYIGPGEGKGSIHIVIARSGKGQAVQDVTTWSLPDSTPADEPGYTWRGSMEDFSNFFKRIN